MWRRLRADPFFWVSSLVLLALILLCFLGPVLYHQDANLIDLSRQNLPPSLRFPLGTNVLGQNELARIMLGGQLPIVAGAVAALFATLLGTLVGLLSAFSHPALDSVLMRITDAFLSIPQAVPILILLSVQGSTAQILVAAVAATSWPVTARLIRSQALVIRRLPYIEATRATGLSAGRTLRRHVLPNMLDLIIVSMTSQFTNAVLLIAIVTFIGLGIGSFDWASMLASDFTNLILGQWWLVIPPGLAFSVLIVSVFLLGESLRKALRPQAIAREG